VITSNVERRLPDAFLRRCIFHHIELTEQLVRNAVQARTGDFPHLDATARDEALAALRFAGVPIGPRELVWLRHAFTLEPSLDRQGLKDLLTCTLIKQNSHREAFESLFTDWCPVEESVIPEPPGRMGLQARDEKKESIFDPPHPTPLPTGRGNSASANLMPLPGWERKLGPERNAYRL
jgi:hypothetical protein